MRETTKTEIEKELDDGTDHNFIDEKKDITNMLIQYCKDSSISHSKIKKGIDNYNTEVDILTSRIIKIRKTIIFKDDLYSVTEKRKITLYKTPDGTDYDTNDSIKNQTYIENAMIQQRAMDLQNMPLENRVAYKDTIIDVTITKNRSEWKEVDIENLFLEIEKSIATKGSNMSFIFEELINECNLELINQEHEMAVDVLTNIRNEFRNLKRKIREYKPTQ